MPNAIAMKHRASKNTKPWSTQALCAFVSVIGVLSTGCGDGRPDRVPVSGRVLIDGRPLERGHVRFYPSNHRAASAALGPEGRFSLTTYELHDGCVVGKHPVSVSGTELINSTTQRWYAPKKYAQAALSELEIDVTEPTDSVEIHLTWDGGKPFDERILGGGD
jgi:hypothetical protein